MPTKSPQKCGDLCYTIAAMMRQYIWQRPGWPDLPVRLDLLAEPLSEVQFGRGQIAGVLRALAASDRTALEFDALTETARDTSEIEGEHLSADSVRASLARRLGLPGIDRGPVDPRADGVVSMTLDATQHAAEPLTKTRLCAWHAALFPNAPASLTIGAWRKANDDPMQVVSGPVSARIVHFEAPPAARVAKEMQAFLRWFESPRTLPPLVHAALAHVWFLTIHPFSDGNGRIARAIADLVLARAEPDVARYVSISRRILQERVSYYDALAKAQREGLDMTAWASWFIECYGRATADTLLAVDELLRAASFWRAHADVELNARQRRVLERYLSGGFEGWLSSRKYQALAKTSADTAQRDLADLAQKGVIVPNDGKARKTSYRVDAAFDPNAIRAALGSPGPDRPRGRGSR